MQAALCLGENLAHSALNQNKEIAALVGRFCVGLIPGKYYTQSQCS
jgi:hypothetical protein